MNNNYAELVIIFIVFCTMFVLLLIPIMKSNKYKNQCLREYPPGSGTLTIISGSTEKEKIDNYANTLRKARFCRFINKTKNQILVEVFN